MSSRKLILLKLTGNIIPQLDSSCNIDLLNSLAEQIKQLKSQYLFSIVIGGSNIFKGSLGIKYLGISAQNSHYCGMLATISNGLVLQDILAKFDVKTTLFCALDCPEIGIAISGQNIKSAKENSDCLIFTAGTGNPYFTTDTNAILRALQTNSNQVWKGTKVDGVYDKDPNLFNNAKFLDKINFEYAIEKKLSIMDQSAFALARENNITIRIFNIFSPNALIKASQDSNFGSTIEIV